MPFPGGSLIQKLDRQRWQMPVPVNQVRPEIPSTLAAVVRRLMAKHPDDRYPSPGELAGVLETAAPHRHLPDWHQPTALAPSATLTGHGGVVTAVVFLDDRTLVSGGADRTVRVWDLASGKEKLRLGDGKHAVGCLAVVPGIGPAPRGPGRDGDAATTSSGREVLRLSGHNDAVRCLALTADGKRLLTGSVDRTVRLWDLAAACEIQRFGLHRAEVTGVALSADGRFALSCSRDGTLRMWETGNGKEVRSFAVPRGPVMALALTPDGQGVYSGHFDTTARLWEVATGREAPPLRRAQADGRGAGRRRGRPRPVGEPRPDDPPVGRRQRRRNSRRGRATPGRWRRWPLEPVRDGRGVGGVRPAHPPVGAAGLISPFSAIARPGYDEGSRRCRPVPDRSLVS